MNIYPEKVMPIYEFRCPKCGHATELIRKMDEPLPPCPKCGEPEMQKLISTSNFTLEGSGWARDNYGLKPAKGSE